MSSFFEIAYATLSGRLCLFTGTGFSKAVTSARAPSWKELLLLACDELTSPESLKESLFPPTGRSTVSLEEAAQIIAIELARESKNLHKIVARIIGDIELSGDNSVISDFLQGNRLSVVTTNYDMLLEQLVCPVSCHSVAPGLPVPRSHANINVYHVHGSVRAPLNMVITSNDYFDFINTESYFSRKLSTILHENTVVILGYSLGDTNLKAIISEYSAYSKNQITARNLFFVSRGKIDQHIKDYYSHCYGMRVLDDMEIHNFFKKTLKSITKTNAYMEGSTDRLKQALDGTLFYSEDHLRLDQSFFEIVSSLSAAGIGIADQKSVALLEKIIKIKTQLSGEKGAWTQYEHLAQWLVYIGTLIEIDGTVIQDTYLDAVFRSMTTMSRNKAYGYSWHAYQSWLSGWFDISPSNRQLIRNHIVAHTRDPDALDIVVRC